MKLREIDKNLTDYNEPTENIKVHGRVYRVSPEFVKDPPSAFVGQAFGSGKEYNRIIGDSVNNARCFYNKKIPIFTQTEIGEFLDRENVYLFGEIYEDGENSKIISKVDSYKVLKQISEKMGELLVPKDNVLYFAHPVHIYRVQDQGRVFGLEGGIFIPEKVVWPENDPQPWVRDPKIWKKREKYGRLFLWLTGKVNREF